MQISLSAAEAQDARASVIALQRALEIEDKYDLLVSNYEEFELCLLSMVLSESLRFQSDWIESYGGIQRVNRVVVNLLTACRLYFDQLAHALSSLYGKGSVLAQAVKEAKSREYDERLGYRVMEEIRNYVQHRGMPVHALKMSGEWITASKQHRKHIRQTIQPELRVDAIASDSGMKKRIVDELAQIGNNHDLKPLVRDYVTGIGNVHAMIRDSMAEDHMRWDTVVESLVSRYEAAGGNPLGLAILRMDGGVARERFAVFTGTIRRRRYLAERNFGLAHANKIATTNY